MEGAPAHGWSLRSLQSQTTLRFHDYAGKLDCAPLPQDEKKIKNKISLVSNFKISKAGNSELILKKAIKILTGYQPIQISNLLKCCK